MKKYQTRKVNKMNSKFLRLIAAVSLLSLVGVFAASCSKPEETKPKNGSYYEGPMKAKDATGSGS